MSHHQLRTSISAINTYHLLKGEHTCCCVSCSPPESLGGALAQHVTPLDLLVVVVPAGHSTQHNLLVRAQHTAQPSGQGTAHSTTFWSGHSTQHNLQVFGHSSFCRAQHTAHRTSHHLQATEASHRTACTSHCTAAVHLYYKRTSHHLQASNSSSTSSDGFGHCFVCYPMMK
jgi:hypothetical protein